MEENQSIISRMHQKIDAILGTVHAQKEEIDRLRNEMTMLRAENEAKNGEISGLYEELANKEREMEGVINKIEEALGSR